MRDRQLEFGETSAALTSSTAGYCEVTLDFGDGKTIFSSSVPIRIVFQATAAVSGFSPAIYTGNTSTPTNEHVLASGESLAVGECKSYPLPFWEGERYMRAGGKASAGKVKAWLELGVALD